MSETPQTELDRINPEAGFIDRLKSASTHASAIVLASLSFAGGGVALAESVDISPANAQTTSTTLNPQESAAEASQAQLPDSENAYLPFLTSKKPPRQVTLSVNEAAPGPAVPDDFIGLSYEAKDLPLVASMADHGNLVSLLRSLGTGVLRFGGVTSDSQVVWQDPANKPLPEWASTALDPADMYDLAKLTQATGWRVLLGLNLVHFDPSAAADEARVAEAALGSSLKAVEIGNEPTAYVAEHLRHGSYTFSQYRQEIEQYRQAISVAVPGLAIVGPDDEPPAGHLKNMVWARNVASQLRPTFLTGHLYGASECDRVPPPASVLLSKQVHVNEQAALGALEHVAGQYKLPVWLDETNDISCGGEPGVSDTYATALWAVDLLTRTLKEPFVGDTFHGFLEKPTGYSPIAALSSAELTKGTLTARPEWDALLLAHQVEGDQPIPIKTEPAGLNVSVWAGKTPEGNLQVIVDDEQLPGSRPLLVRIKDKTLQRAASILRLNGSSIKATTGVTLGGNLVSPDGNWQAQPTLPAVEASNGVLGIPVSPASAVLITTQK